MKASGFITYFTYMLRHNVIPFWKELFVAFKMAPMLKTHSLYFSSYRPLYKGHSFILIFSEFGTCADIVSKIVIYSALVDDVDSVLNHENSDRMTLSKMRK